MIKVAIAILNWNGRELLEKFLPSVINYSKLPDSKIFVIDNYSTDDSVAFLKQRFPEVSLNWLEIIQIMDTDRQIAACQPKLKSFTQKEYFEYAGAAGGFIDKYGYTFCRGRIFNVFEIDSGQYNLISDIFWATGACLFIRADLYNSIGGLDSRFFAHMEEIDLCWRLKNRGYRIVYYPGSEVFHLGGGTLNKTNPQKTYLNFRNNLFLLYKNLPPGKLVYTLFIRMILDGVAAFKFLLGFEFDNFYAVLKAHLSFYSNFLKFKKARIENIANNIVYNHPEIYNGSIVYGFFFKKIRKFGQIKMDLENSL